MANNVPNGFSGPLTLQEIRKHLSIKKLPTEIEKRKTIEVSQPSRTIYDESPEVDLLIRMELKDEEDLELTPDFVDYLNHLKREPNRSKVDDSFEDSGVKSEDSVVVILDEETSFNCSEEKLQVSALNNSIIYIDDDDEEVEEVPVLEYGNNMSVLIKEEAGEYEKSHEEDLTTSKENCSLDSDEWKGTTMSALIEEESRHSQELMLPENDYNYIEPRNTFDYPSEQSFLSTKSFDNSECAESMFNDTLEEVKMALKYGLDYTMHDDNVSDIDTENVLRSSPTLQTQTSPSVIPDTPRPKYSEKQDFQFKQPLIKQIPAKSKTPNYKSVVSPVALYIKNSPRCPILRNVQASNALGKKTLFPNPEPVVTNKCNKENVLKPVVYKPPRQIIKESAPSLKLPSNIQKLLPRTPTVIKHQGRADKKQDDLVEEKLLSEDISVIDSSRLDSTVPLEEISVHYSKDAYIL